jgi:hypothetical protein
VALPQWLLLWTTLSARNILLHACGCTPWQQAAHLLKQILYSIQERLLAGRLLYSMLIAC